MKNNVRHIISKGQNTNCKLKAVLLSPQRQKLTTWMHEKILDVKVKQKSRNEKKNELEILHFSGRLPLIKTLKAILTPFLTTVTNLTDLQISILGLSHRMSMFCQILWWITNGLGNCPKLIQYLAKSKAHSQVIAGNSPFHLH